MIKDYWIYQEREVTTPWAIYIVKEYDPRHPETASLDYVLYHEDIPNESHSESYIDIWYEDAKGYVNEIICAIAAYSTVHFEDKVQLTKAIKKILKDR